MQLPRNRSLAQQRVDPREARREVEPDERQKCLPDGRSAERACSLTIPLSPAEEDDVIEQAVLASLLVEHPVQLTMLDLYRERAEPNNAAQQDAVDRAVQSLVAAGLAHRNGPFVIPSRAAMRFEALESR
jgi:hypothetical protein